MSFIGATGYNENQEQLDTLKDEIDANASYINNLVGIPDPLHTAIFGINLLNPGLFGLVERAEVNIKALQTGLEGEGTTISGIETTISGIETTISGIETEVSGIQSEILGIQGEITGIDSTISSIEFVQLPALSTSLAILIGATDVIAVDARNKANRALDIWDYSGDNVYHKKAGNVGIGTTFGSVLTNKLEVQGNINIPTGSTFRIGDEPFNYSHLAGEQPVSSKWTNATDVATNIYYNTGNVGIGVTTAINNKLEVAGNINIPTGSKYKINNVDLAFSDLGTLSYNSLSDKPTLFDGNYNSLTNKLTAGTNINIIGNAINNTYTLPMAGVGAGGTLGGVRVDNSTIFINGSGIISSVSTASGASISLDGSTNNRSYGWTGSTSLLGRVGVAETYAIGSLVEDVVLRSQGRLLLQSGTNNPALTIQTTTNNILVRNSIGIGTTSISSGNLIDVGGFFKVAFNAPVDALTLTSTGVQINHTLNVSSGLNAGGLIRLGGFADDSSLDLAIIQNREYVANKSELLLFKGDNIEGTNGVDRIRLRSGAIAFDTYSTDATTSATTENIRMYIDGNGRVGIGTTTIPAGTLLDVNGSIVSRLNVLTNNAFIFRATTNSDISRVITAGDYSTNSQVNDIVIRSNNKLILQSGIGAPAIVISTTNNVGIGTTAPIGRLHLHRENATFSQDVNLHFTDTLTGTTATDGFVIGKGSDNIAYLYNNENTDMVFANNGGERMRILANGNVGIGTNNPTSRLHIPTPDVATPFALLDFRNNTNFGIYATSQSVASRGNTLDFLARDYNNNGSIATRNILSLRPEGNVSFAANVWHTCLTGNRRLYFDPNSTTYIEGYGGTPIVFRNGDDQFIASIGSVGNLIVNNYVLSNARVYSRGGGFDTFIYSDSGGMTLNMGNQSTENAPSYFRMGAYGGHTFYESNSNRNHRFFIYTGVLTGTSREWRFNESGLAFNAINSTTWTQASDQRIKENIVKADLNKCYDNVKNINLYRYKFIDEFETSSEDKNKLGYIAQEVKRHFPKATIREKRRLSDKREIPDLLTIDVEQINLTLYGAVKQLIKIVEKQNKRIKTLETLLNIDDNDDVENDAGEAYERIYDEEEVDIDTIEPTEPEQDKAPMGVSSPSDEQKEVVINEEEDIEEINVD